MKTKFVFAILTIVTLISCKKDAKVTNNVNDSLLTGDSIVLNPAQNPNAFTIDPIDAESSIGKTIFSKDGKAIIDFDTQGNEGIIKINGMEIPLNRITFSENNYQIEGNDIVITAENGNFDEMVSDCNYGTFSDITINYKNNKSIISDVKVQDCPNY